VEKTLKNQFIALQILAGPGFEPGSKGYEPFKEPLLQPAINLWGTYKNPKWKQLCIYTNECVTGMFLNTLVKMLPQLNLFYLSVQQIN